MVEMHCWFSSQHSIRDSDLIRVPSGTLVLYTSAFLARALRFPCSL